MKFLTTIAVVFNLGMLFLVGNNLLAQSTSTPPGGLHLQKFECKISFCSACNYSHTHCPPTKAINEIACCGDTSTALPSGGCVYTGIGEDKCKILDLDNDFECDECLGFETSSGCIPDQCPGTAKCKVVLCNPLIQ